MSIHRFRHEQLDVFVADSTREMADAAAEFVAGEIARRLRELPEVNVVFAGAESQMEFHQSLVRRADIDWPRVNAFGVDEFWCPGLPAACAVCEQPRRDLYSRVSVKSVHVLDPNAPDAEAEAKRYADVLSRQPLHIACLGIGQSGHLAFNEPGDTDFADPRIVRVMDVCEQSKRQLMTDPNFRSLGRIPDKGITMTVPALLAVETLLCVVPYASKAEIIGRFFRSEASADLPATAVKSKAGVRVFLDRDSGSKMPGAPFVTPM